MRYLTFLLFIFGLTKTVFGQENKFAVGLEGGPSLICFHSEGSTLPNSQADFGFSGGLSFQYNFSKIFSLRTGFAFERKGFFVSHDRIDYGTNYYFGEYKIDYKCDYLTVPVLLRASFGNRVKLFCNVGIFAGYALKQTSTVQWGGSEWYNGSSPASTTTDYSTPSERLDEGLVGGIGLSIPLAKTLLISLEIRDNFGLHDRTRMYRTNTNSTNLLIGMTYKFAHRPLRTNS